ncbi:MAG: FAD-binding monooxygenase [Alphaproteobacteria bacterium]|nr:MAG: FAD-binding monooxygenase [Alphaproteobacteria bacterium]
MSKQPSPYRILITGASVTGNTVAWWLARAGHKVTVAEHASGFRDGGQNIDVRGVGREVLRRMGLEQTALQQGTGEEGTAWVEEDGTVAAQFLTAETGIDGPTAEMEILRGDLARLLYEPASERATYRFGDSIVGVEQNHDGATVTFASGTVERYDLVVVAEGVGSRTRELVFPGENKPRWMNLTIAYLTVPRRADDDRLWRWYNASGGRSVSLRPDRHATARAMLSVQKPPSDEQNWDTDRQKAWLRQRFADAGWQTDRVLTGMELTDDFYFDVLRQVRMPRWAKDRVVLTGDAAWCATPIAGYGTTLAITGAYVLARELIRSTDVHAAVAAYEQTMRPMVEDAQGVPKLAPRLANPHTRLGIRLLHGVLKVASRPAVRGLAGKVFGGRSKDVDLARYDMPLSDVLPLETPAASSREVSPILVLSAVAVVISIGMLVRRRKAPSA